MKVNSIVLTIWLLVPSIMMTAQTSQGSILLGASTTHTLAASGDNIMTLGYSTIKSKSDRAGFDQDEGSVTSLNISPKVGYFLLDNVAIGLDLNLSYSSSKDEASKNQFTQSIVGGGPFLRYYFPTAKVLPYAEIGGTYAVLNSSLNDVNLDEKSSITAFGGSLGVAAPLGERTTLDISAGYTSFTLKETENNINNDRTIIGTLGLKLGFSIFFNKGQSRKESK